MKKYALLLIVTVSLFSLSCFAQRSNRVSANARMGNGHELSDNLSDDERVVISYHVEERINMAFGSSITTYNVSNVDLISKKELGPNNIRIVTPRYARVKAKPKAKEVLAVSNEPAPVETKIPPVETVAAIEPAAVTEVAAPAKPKSVDIDILKTYERVLDKGYKSVDMLKRVGNGRFFDGDLVTAAKWYSQLFDMTADLEPILYYRYAQSLIAIRETEKANAMMELFNSKNL